MTASASIVILYNELSPDATLDELDVLDQVEAVAVSLRQSGYAVSRLPFASNVESLAKVLSAMKPACVFNLVESVASEGRLSYLAPALLEELGIHFTGNSAEAIRLTTDKLATKRQLRRLGIATPAWVSLSDAQGFIDRERYIIKAVYEDASVGISQSSLAALAGMAEARSSLGIRLQQSSREHFAERYIDGREISISILGEGGRPRLLPPTEIHFLGYHVNGLAKIVDYRAKWDSNSFEYQNTIPTIVCSVQDQPLIRELETIAMTCWDEFGMRGYARIDFRIDAAGRPWVLEINANPCLSPDESGFIRSAHASGLGYQSVIDRLVTEAITASDGRLQLREKGAS